MTRQITIDKTETNGFAARIQNRGQSNGTQTVELYKDGVLVTDEANLTLTPDETTYVLEAPTVFSDASHDQTLTMEVVTDNMTRTVEVLIYTMPDSVVSRDPDDTAGSGATGPRGIKFTVLQDWHDFQARLSGNQTTLSDNHDMVIGDTNGTIIARESVVGLSANDVVTFTSVDLSANNSYHVSLESTDGDTFNYGFDDDPSLPYSSSDGNLTIDSGWVTGSTNSKPFCIAEIGNINL